MYGNNIENFAFDKSGWQLVEVSADGNTIYMGKTNIATALPEHHAWFIKRITISQTEEGGQLIKTEIAVGENDPWENVWDDRASLTYKYFYELPLKKTLCFCIGFGFGSSVFYKKEKSGRD